MPGLLAVLGLLLLFSSCSKKPVYTGALFDGNRVRIELKSLPEKKAVFYTFHYGDNKGINYFVIKLNGEVQSYFDACVKCYPKRLGYRPHNDRLFCRACDVDYSVHDLKDGIGSCYPIKLNGTVDGGFYLIDKKDLLQGLKYF
jgi:uncharacterized membrane protein